MNKIKPIVTFIWVMNIALIGGTAYFLPSVIFPEKKLKNKEYKVDTSIKGNGTVVNRKEFPSLKFLPNPMKIDKGVNPHFVDNTGIGAKIIVVASWPHPTLPTCSIELKTQPGKQLTAFFKEAIVELNGNPVLDLAGWVLVEAYESHVFFENGTRREEVKVKGSSIGSDTPFKIHTNVDLKTITDYRQLNSQSVRDKPTDSFESWQIDPKEAEWISLKQEEILSNEVVFLPVSDGGVRITHLKENSVISARGFQKDDIIKSINRRKVSSLDEARKIANALRNEGPSVVTIVVNRAGKDYTMTYRLKTK